MASYIEKIAKKLGLNIHPGEIARLEAETIAFFGDRNSSKAREYINSILGEMKKGTVSYARNDLGNPLDIERVLNEIMKHYAETA